MSDVNKVQIQKNFGQNAITYDQYAVVQKEMAGRLLAKIQGTGRHFQRILEIGCGTGFLTELLAREYPKALITALDIAPQMIAVAREKLNGFNKINYFVADGENLQKSDTVSLNKSSFDLIVSNAVFQWFAKSEVTFAHYQSLLDDGGYMIFSTFGEGTFKELYCCLGNKRNPFLNSQDLEKILANSGFQSVSIEEVSQQEYFDSCRNFLRSLKKVGAHNYLAEELAGQGLGSGIFSLIDQYNALFSSEQGVPATYQCLFGVGQKGLT